jgi:hypothetical protein
VPAVWAILRGLVGAWGGKLALLLGGLAAVVGGAGWLKRAGAKEQRAADRLDDAEATSRAHEQRGAVEESRAADRAAGRDGELSKWER